MWRAGSRTAIAVSLALPHLAHAQPAAGEQRQVQGEAPPARKPPAPQRQLRLSDWLLQQKPTPDAYPLGLSWRIPEEVPPQMALKLELVSLLAGEDRIVRADAGAMKRLRHWLAGLPATGRVPVTLADGRWLQMNPAHDPVLGPGYSVVMPRRPRTVTVITGDGMRCAVVHQAGREAKAYIEACRTPGGGGSDWAWVAQPDGRVQRSGVALWNAGEQDEPAAGAWIWAPGRWRGWPEAFSEKLIRFLATQGPAPDPAPAEKASPETAAAPSAPAVEHITDARAPEPGEEARGVTSGSGAGFVLGGGMSMGLSDTLLAQGHSPGPPEPPELPTRPGEPVVLREERTTRSRSAPVSSSDWGSVGLLQSPTARMRETGHLSFHYSRVRPYGHGNVMFQPFDWMEAGFRYTNVSNRLYGPAELSGDQAYKDKSIDVKFRLWEESALLPQVAIGLRDIGGTGLFAGEYVVANKRTGDFDWSVGLGWGYVGARGNLRNPLSNLSSRFDTRTGTTGQGGDFSLERYFRGPASVFGGVQYHTPWEPLTIKVEYDGNDYKNEPQSNNQRQSSPVNAAFVYRAARGVDLSLGVERGNTVMFGITLYTDLSRLTQPKVNDPRPVPVAAARPVQPADWNATARELGRQTDWNVRSIEQRDNEVRVVLDDAGAMYWRSRIDRGTAVLHRDAPPNVDLFTFTYRSSGLEVAEHVVDREAWVSQRTRPVPPREQRQTVIARPPESFHGDVMHKGAGTETFQHGLRLSYAQTLGGPDAFVLWQLGLVESARLRLRDDTWVQGSVRLRVADNYEKFKYTGPSNLPRVRTFLREYLTTSTVTVPNLQISHVGKVADNHYYSAYGGLLEEMYAGAGGEWLYRPFGSRVAFGVDVNAVRQREFEQRFGTRDYSTVTGHATMYWDTGWNDVIATLSVGRYLAKDIGATLNLARTFRNGVSVGAFATKTNVSAVEFGEGSFDKGIFVNIPFDALFTRSSRSLMTTVWKPLTRDGGAMLVRSLNLYNVTGARSDRTLWYEPAPLPPERLKPSEQRPQDTSKTSAAAEPYTRVTTKVPAERWQRETALEEHRLAEALYAQGFRNVKVDYDQSHRLIVTASHEDLRPVSVAVGRAARTALLQAPIEARGIEVTLLRGASPQARYEFFDLPRLERYLDGDLKAEELTPYVKVHWINPAAAERDPIARTDDLETESRPRVLTGLVPETLSVSRVANDYLGAARAATRVDWLRAGLAGASLVLTSSLLDNRANRFASEHANKKWLTNGVRLGNALPWLAVGGAGLAAIDGSDPRRSRTGYAALEAGATALVATQGLKYAVGRARPATGLPRTRFEPGSRNDSFHSFPSTHTMVAWSVLTPFALEYDAPWLYGVAAAANLARIGSREHWVSDTVASSLIGYGLGRLFWQSGREQGKGEPKVFFDGTGLSMLWDWR